MDSLLPDTETCDNIPLECGSIIWSQASRNRDDLLPTCKNKITRLIRLSNGRRIFCCGHHVDTDQTCDYGNQLYVDTLIRQSRHSNVFNSILKRKTTVIRKDKKFVLKFMDNGNKCSRCNECSICMEPVSPLSGGHLKCEHSFHNTCITKWFIKNKDTCPYCRNICDINSFVK